MCVRARVTNRELTNEDGEMSLGQFERAIRKQVGVGGFYCSLYQQVAGVEAVATDPPAVSSCVSVSLIISSSLAP